MTAENAKLYRCPVCDTVVEMLDRVGMELVCCGPPMEPLEANVAQWQAPAHIPLVRHDARGITVRVGDGRHPMDADHHIQWIELRCGAVCTRQFLQPGQTPQVFFAGVDLSKELILRVYCNLHGLWQSRVSIGCGARRHRPRPAADGNAACRSAQWAAPSAAGFVA